MTNLLETDLLQFNAFGLVTIQREKLTATLTAISGERSITRSIRESILVEDINSDETVVLTVGVLLQDGKSRVTVHEVGSEKYEYLMAEIPQVREVIDRAVEMVKKGANIS